MLKDKRQRFICWFGINKIVPALRLLTVLMFVSCLLPPAQCKSIDWEKKLESGYYELSIGNVDKAVDWFTKKVKSYPGSGACHTALGEALKKKGKLSEAKAEFQMATEVEPAYADGFYELGALLEADKEYLRAAQAFERYLTLKPDSNRKGAVADRIRFCREHS